MSAEDVNFLFTLREQVKLYHWQTKSYSRHKATDDLIKALDESIDTYVETYMGKYGRPKMSKSTGTIKITNLSEADMLPYLTKAIAHLNGPLAKKLKPTDTDLLNLRDEMLGELNKLMYLFTLD